MGNRTSRVVECFVPIANGKGGVDLEFLEPLDEGLGHSFCYVRPVITDSPTITPSNSERFTIYSSTLDSETQSGSFRREIVEDSLGLQRPNKNFPETTFKTISGASVSANVSTARSVDQNALFTSDAQEPAASFESTSSFAAIPLQPVPRGSGPLNGFMSGPLERGFASGPLERGAGFMSGPIEKGVFMSGPLDYTDRSNFSAPLAFNRRRAGFGRLMRSMSRPMRSALSQTFVRHSVGSGWMRRFFLHPVTRFAWHPREGKLRNDVPRSCFEEGPPVGEYSKTRNLQWAHGKAGEDRVHVVLSEEQGWLFVGIYDGFSGPDAPDFLMRNLYRAIDKELEGLLWDYEDKSGTNSHVPGLVEKDSARAISDCRKENHLFSQSCGDDLEKLCTMESMNDACDVDENEQKRLDMEKTSADQSMQAEEIGEDKHEYGAELQLASEINEDLEESTGTGNVETVGHSDHSEQITITDQKAQVAGHGRKSKRLYELLEMDGWDVWGFASESEVSSWRRRASWDLQPNEKGLNSRENLPEAKSMSHSRSNRGSSSNQLGEDISSREHAGIVKEESNNGIVGSFSIPKQNQVKRSLIGSKLKTICRKQKSLRKKLLPWNYDWHRDGTHVEKPVFDSLVPLRTCKSAPVDHEAVLSAMARALESTEEAYMEMVEKALDKNPELALMGSCVLVMLMKDQDVYVMNLGDSRVILAQEGPDNSHENPDVVKDDSGHRKRSRESLIRVELDRISEESPMRNQTIEVSNLNKSRGISICRLKMRALQLSTDHNTNIEEEVLRIKSEHADDNQAMLNERVKGQLKVTRAFGAGFLKKPKCNEALLEMFQIDYVGNAPYLSCIPSVWHHRLCSNDRFLVLSSDGLYQYFSNEEVVSHVGWFMENVPDGDPAQYLIAELLFRAAKKNGMDFHELLDIPHGDRRKYHDDVSVMVISLEGRIWRSSG